MYEDTNQNHSRTDQTNNILLFNFSKMHRRRKIYIYILYHLFKYNVVICLRYIFEKMLVWYCCQHFHVSHKFFSRKCKTYNQQGRNVSSKMKSFEPTDDRKPIGTHEHFPSTQISKYCTLCKEEEKYKKKGITLTLSIKSKIFLP